MLSKVKKAMNLPGFFFGFDDYFCSRLNLQLSETRDNYGVSSSFNASLRLIVSFKNQFSCERVAHHPIYSKDKSISCYKTTEP